MNRCTELYHNRFSVLITVDDNVSDEKEDINVEKVPVNNRLFGGGKNDKKRAKKKDERPVTDSSVGGAQSPPAEISEPEVSVNSNIESEGQVSYEVSFVQEPVESNKTKIESNLQELETTTRDVSVDGEPIHLEIEEIIAETDISTNEITRSDLSIVTENTEDNTDETIKNDTVTDSSQIADASLDDVIELLNCKEIKCSLNQGNSICSGTT